MRIEKSGERYFSLVEFAAAYGITPTNKTNKAKLKEQRDKFLGHHKCAACHRPMVWIGGNIMCCTNESCRGIKHTRKDDEGNESVWFEPSFEELDDKFAGYANYLFEQ